MSYVSIQDHVLQKAMAVVSAAEEYTLADDMFMSTILDACDTDNPIAARWREARDALWLAVEVWERG